MTHADAAAPAAREALYALSALIEECAGPYQDRPYAPHPETLSQAMKARDALTAALPALAEVPVTACYDCGKSTPTSQIINNDGELICPDCADAAYDLEDEDA